MFGHCVTLSKGACLIAMAEPLGNPFHIGPFRIREGELRDTVYPRVHPSSARPVLRALVLGCPRRIYSSKRNISLGFPKPAGVISLNCSAGVNLSLSGSWGGGTNPFPPVGVDVPLPDLILVGAFA